MFEVVRAAEIVDEDIRLVVAAGREKAHFLRCDHVRDHRLVEANEFCDAGLYRRDLGGADVLGDEDGKARHQFCPHHLADNGVIVQPVEHALRIKLGVIGITDMEHVFPGNEDVVEHGKIIELVAGRCHRMLDRIVLHRAFPAYHRDAFGVDWGHGEDDLFGRDARPEENTDMDPVAEGDAGTDRLDAVDHDALVVGLDHAERR